MGFFLLASLFSVGAGLLITDIFSGQNDGDDNNSEDDNKDTGTPTSGEGSGTDTDTDTDTGTDTPDGDTEVSGQEYFLNDQEDAATEGTAGDDVVEVMSNSAVFDAGDGDDTFALRGEQAYYHEGGPSGYHSGVDYEEPAEGRIGPVLTGGEGADRYTFDPHTFTGERYWHEQPLDEDNEFIDIDKEHWPTSGPFDFGDTSEAFEITDFNPAEDQLIIPKDAFLGKHSFSLGLFAVDTGSTYGSEDYPFDEISVEPAEGGSYTDVVFKADIIKTYYDIPPKLSYKHAFETESYRTDEILRIRLWGLDDFDPSQILIAPEEGSDAAPQPIQIDTDGTLLARSDTVVMGGHDADDVTLEDTENSLILTRDGDDTVTGGVSGTSIYTEGGDDVAEISGPISAWMVAQAMTRSPPIQTMKSPPPTPHGISLPQPRFWRAVPGTTL